MAEARVPRAAAAAAEVAMEIDEESEDETRAEGQARRVAIGLGLLTLAQVQAVTGDVTRRVRGRAAGLGRGLEGWRRHREATIVAGARVRVRRAGRGGRTFVNRRILDYAKATARRWGEWAWGAVQREWREWAAWRRRRRPEVGGEERVHGRPPDS